MDQNSFEGRWQQVRGKAKEWCSRTSPAARRELGPSWSGQFTDDELDQVAGKQQAEQEIDRRMGQAA